MEQRTFFLHDRNEQRRRVLADLFGKQRWIEATRAVDALCMIVHMTESWEVSKPEVERAVARGSTLVEFSGGSPEWRPLRERHYYGGFDELVFRLRCWVAERADGSELARYLSYDASSFVWAEQSAYALGILCQGFLVAHLDEAGQVVKGIEAGPDWAALERRMRRELGLTQLLATSPDVYERVVGRARKARDVTESCEWWLAGLGAARPVSRLKKTSAFVERLWETSAEGERPSADPVSMLEVIDVYTELSDHFLRLTNLS